MLVYALTSPFAGYTVDRLSRRLLIPLGLAFWSLICAATAFSRNFVQLILLRGCEGLGESFYFPASMSMLSDYHGPRTRSRAMSIHQTSVYLGTAGGWYLGGALGQQYGWQSPFWALGLAGMAYALMLGICLVEPRRAAIEGDTTKPTGDDESKSASDDSGPLFREDRANRNQSRRRHALGRLRGGQLRRDDLSDLVTNVCIEKVSISV